MNNYSYEKIVLNNYDFHKNSITNMFQMEWEYDKNTYISSSLDKTIKIWNLSTFQCLDTLLGHSNAVTGLCQLKKFEKNEIIVSGSNDGTLKFWNILKKICFLTIELENFGLYTLIHLDNQFYFKNIIFTDFYKNIVILNLDSNNLEIKNSYLKNKIIKLNEINIKILSGHNSIVSNLIEIKGVSEKGCVITLLASGSKDKTIKIWNLKSFKCIRTLIGHNSWISSMVQLKNFIVGSSFDGKIIFWDWKKGKIIKILYGENKEPYDIYKILLFKINFKSKIISFGEDKCVCIWNHFNGDKLKIPMENKDFFSFLFQFQNYCILSINGKFDVIKIVEKNNLQS